MISHMLDVPTMTEFGRTQPSDIEWRNPKPRERRRELKPGPLRGRAIVEELTPPRYHSRTYSESACTVWTKCSAPSPKSAFDNPTPLTINHEDFQRRSSSTLISPRYRRRFILPTSSANS